MNRIDFLHEKINEALSRHAVGVYAEFKQNINKFINYNIRFLFDIDEFERKYFDYYLPASKEYSKSIVPAEEVMDIREKYSLHSGYFEEPVQECLRSGYVAVYHKVESLVKHIEAFVNGKNYGIFRDYGSENPHLLSELSMYDLKKEQLYKTETTANIIVNRIRVIANCCKHDDGYLLPSNGSIAKLAMKIDSENRIVLDELGFMYNIRFLKAYAQLLFHLVASMMLKGTLESVIKKYVENNYEELLGDEIRIELVQFRQEKLEAESNIHSAIDAIKANDEVVFWQKLCELDIVKTVPIQDLTPEQESQVLWKRYD